MNQYLSRGVLRNCTTGGSSLAEWSEQEKDRLANIVLQLVDGLVSRRPPDEVPTGWEPTGVGYLDDDVRDYVMKRSA